MKKIFQGLIGLGVASASLSPIAMISSNGKVSKPLSDAPQISDPINTSKDDIIDEKSQKIIDLQKDIEKLKIQGQRILKRSQDATRDREDIIKTNRELSAHITQIRKEHEISINKLKVRHNEEISKKQQEIDDYVEKQKSLIANKWLISQSKKIINELKAKNAEILLREAKVRIERQKYINELETKNAELLESQKEFDTYVKKQREIEDTNLLFISKQNTLIDKLNFQIELLKRRLNT